MTELEKEEIKEILMGMIRLIRDGVDDLFVDEAIRVQEDIMNLFDHE